MPIAMLDDATIGKIAAGEVIERPASVVKELVENALDAHAHSIRVEIASGGKELIRVRDDGDGIDPDDLLLSVKRHTTSKLRDFDDLNHLASFGFRGEALASVASVAELEILSRPPQDRAGWMLRSEFGQSPTTVQTAASAGSTITVRDLFGNVPARRKFLKQDATESGYVQRVVSAYALAFPEVRFDLISDGKPVIATDGSGSLLNAAVGVFGSDVAGELIQIEPPDFDDSTEADDDRPVIGVSGAIGLPNVTRGNRQQMILLINRRWIEHRSLSFAIEQSYHTLIMVGRYPIAVVNVSVPADRVDVNVHPTKREVRFSDERLIFSSVQRAVRGTLMNHTPAQSIPQVIESPLSAESVQRRMTLANPERVNRPQQSLIEQRDERVDDERVLPPEAIELDVPILRVLGQVSGTYIIAEGPNGMYLVDQHAAHERILLERLLNQFERQAPESQRMLEPLVVELTLEQSAAAADASEDLQALGFEIESFGGGSIALRAVPAIMARRDPTRTLQTILDDMVRGGNGRSKFESVAMSTACHSAIRAGQSLSIGEMRELLTQLEGCTAPRACAHGRPTVLHLSQDELERQFSRR